MAAKPPPRYLHVKDFDDAIKQLLDLLRDSDGTAEGKTKAFLFAGWYGLGSSAVLRAVAEFLKSTRSDSDMRKHFGKIIHLDCSLWKNRREMQRAIVEELNLGHLMPMFDKQDEDDDFRGVDDSSRAEITTIGSVIHEYLIYEKFLLIFHYGGDVDIDLAECGVPRVGNFGKGKILWTNCGRFQLWREQKLMSSFDTICMDIRPFDYTYDPHDYTYVGQQLRHLLHKDAIEVIGYTGMDDINPATVVDCFLYSVFLTEQLRGSSNTLGYGWATHACNYWICDGILQGERAWEVGNALYGVIPQLGYSSGVTKYLAEHLDRGIRPGQGWISVTSNKLGAHNVSKVPVNASSYFLTFVGGGQPELRSDLFQLANNLHVLKLCCCSFDFTSPPFHFCHNLRFLWLDHCTNTGNEQGGGPCFPNLLVLDLCYTEYVLLPHMIELMTNLRELNTKGVSWRIVSHGWKKLQNLQKLRLTESSDVITVDSCSFIDMNSLELLDLSGNTHMESLPTLSSASSLKVLILDGCFSLENVALEGPLPLLECFSFDGYGPAKNWIHPIQLPEKELRPKSHVAPARAMVRKISLEGCARLQSIFLRALPNLMELDLSGTTIKTLDLDTMDVPHLKKLFLMGCDQLHSLLYDGYHPVLEVLHVDTRGKTRSVVCCREQKSFGFEACIAFREARFAWRVLRGLVLPRKNQSKVHLHISSTIHSQANITKSIEEIDQSQEGVVPIGSLLPYSDIVLGKDVIRSCLAWDHRQLQPLDKHIEIGEGCHNLERLHENDYFRFFIRRHVESLHVHDNSSITAIPQKYPENWVLLQWCHVERCPKLHTLFNCSREKYNFQNLKTFSAFDLPTAYFIWDRGINCQTQEISSFGKLHHIYLHNCPKLVFVLPISFTLPNLETLHIAYCRNLQHVFPLDDEYPQVIASGVTFKNLKHIKLHHLHKLEQICEARLTAPALETISLRDCWGLRRLPAVARQGPKPVVDCEEDWWDKLEWDGLEANHDPLLFATRHSTYYKKTIPRGSLLR